MNVFVVLAHPDTQSFNGAMFDTAVRTFESSGHTVAAIESVPCDLLARLAPVQRSLTMTQD